LADGWNREEMEEGGYGIGMLEGGVEI